MKGHIRFKMKSHIQLVIREGGEGGGAVDLQRADDSSATGAEGCRQVGAQEPEGTYVCEWG